MFGINQQAENGAWVPFSDKDTDNFIWDVSAAASTDLEERAAASIDRDTEEFQGMDKVLTILHPILSLYI